MTPSEPGICVIAAPATGTATTAATSSQRTRFVASSPNITSANVVGATGNPGVVCFTDLSFAPTGVLATTSALYGLASANRVIVAGNVQGVAQGCPFSTGFEHQAFVTGWNEATNSAADNGSAEAWVYFF